MGVNPRVTGASPVWQMRNLSAPPHCCGHLVPLPGHSKIHPCRGLELRWNHLPHPWREKKLPCRQKNQPWNEKFDPWRQKIHRWNQKKLPWNEKILPCRLIAKRLRKTDLFGRHCWSKGDICSFASRISFVSIMDEATNPCL